MILDPSNTTIGDICTEALFTSGAFGVGQAPLAEDSNYAWAQVQWMLQEWARKRWLVYHNVIKTVTCTGALSYTIGPGGDIDTGVGSNRPDKLEAGFLRQLVQSVPNQIDTPIGDMFSMEDYSRLAQKQLKGFPDRFFYDPAWPLGLIYPWPVPQASIYAIGVVLKEQLPTSFAAYATKVNLPFEYYSVIHYNLAMRLRAHYQVSTFPGDSLPGLAKNALNVLRKASTAIASLQMPSDVTRQSIYNIFTDRSY